MLQARKNDYDKLEKLTLKVAKKNGDPNPQIVTALFFLVQERKISPTDAAKVNRALNMAEGIADGDWTTTNTTQKTITNYIKEYQEAVTTLNQLT